MMTKLERLIDLAIAWFERDLGTTEKEPKAARKSKKEAAAETPAAGAPAAAVAAATISPAELAQAEKESYAELTKHMMAFIDKPNAGYEERRAVCEKHVLETYKVASLGAVPHGPQRTQLTQWAKDQVAKRATAPAAAGGFGV